MTKVIDGTLLFNSLYAGYRYFLHERKEIDAINLFPVPDGDTGSNIAHTLSSIFKRAESHASVGVVMHSIAEQALFNARGNSGMILAQFFNGFHKAVKTLDTLTVERLVDAINSGVRQAYQAVEKPVEGTILTVMRKLSQGMSESFHSIFTIPQLMKQGLQIAQKAEIETSDEMAVLKKAGVVDAGAKAFVAILKGVHNFIRMGSSELPEDKAQPFIFSSHAADQNRVSETSLAEEPKGGRFCSEAIVRGTTVTTDHLKEVLHDGGDSLVVGEFEGSIRVHQHTDNPAKLFHTLSGFGTLSDKKVEDIHHQFLTVHRPLSSTVIITDSSADLPPGAADDLRIQTIPQQILFSDEEHLDRLTIDNDILMRLISEKNEFPTSSMASIGSIRTLLEYLSEYYESIIVISIAAALSGTYQAYNLAAGSLKESGYPIHIIDSHKNASAQGLLALHAARMAAEGTSADSIVRRIENMRDDSGILVSVQDISHMIRSGRISGTVGKIAEALRLHPIAGLKPEGSGTIKGVSFSKRGAIQSLLKKIGKIHKQSGGITSFAVSFVRDSATAEKAAQLITKMTGLLPEFIVPASPIITMFAGDGAVSVAYTTS